MKYYIISLILASFIAIMIGINKYFYTKKEYMIKEINQITNNGKELLSLRTKYKELEQFINIRKITPLKKNVAYEKTLEVLEKLRKKFSIEIIEQNDKRNYYEIKFNFNENYKDKKRLVEFFNLLFNKEKFFIPSIESFDYKTTAQGTQIESLIKLSIPYME